MTHSAACVRVLYRKNEEIDDKSMIRRLRKRIAELETQLSLARTAEVMMLRTGQNLVACAAGKSPVPLHGLQH